MVIKRWRRCTGIARRSAVDLAPSERGSVVDDGGRRIQCRVEKVGVKCPTSQAAVRRKEGPHLSGARVSRRVANRPSSLGIRMRTSPDVSISTVFCMLRPRIWRPFFPQKLGPYLRCKVHLLVWVCRIRDVVGCEALKGRNHDDLAVVKEVAGTNRGGWGRDDSFLSEGTKDKK